MALSLPKRLSHVRLVVKEATKPARIALTAPNGLKVNQPLGHFLNNKFTQGTARKTLQPLMPIPNP